MPSPSGCDAKKWHMLITVYHGMAIWVLIHIMTVYRHTYHLQICFSYFSLFIFCFICPLDFSLHAISAPVSSVSRTVPAWHRVALHKYFRINELISIET